jgi:hypothetical protein
MNAPARLAALVALPALAVGLAACQPAKPITRLDCPQTSGKLSLISAEPDGRRCAYRGEGDLQLTLSLLPLTGAPAAALEPIEDDLRTKYAPDSVAPSAPADTHIDLPGLHVSTSDQDDHAEVKVGPVTIKADDGGAEVRTGHDVRLKGQSLSPAKNGYRAEFLLAGEHLKGGYHAAGYEAAGPKTGPLVVGVFTAKGDPDDLDAKDDIERLVRRNAGV